MNDPLCDFLLEDKIVVLSDNEPVCLSFGHISDFTLTLGDLRQAALRSTPPPAPAVTGDVREALLSAQAALSDGAFTGPMVDNALKQIATALSQQAPETDAEEVDPADVWDEYCAEVPADRRSPQGAMAFALSRPDRQTPGGEA